MEPLEEASVGTRRKSTPLKERVIAFCGGDESSTRLICWLVDLLVAAFAGMVRCDYCSMNSTCKEEDAIYYEYVIPVTGDW